MKRAILAGTVFFPVTGVLELSTFLLAPGLPARDASAAVLLVLSCYATLGWLA